MGPDGLPEGAGLLVQIVTPAGVLPMSSTFDLDGSAKLRTPDHESAILRALVNRVTCGFSLEEFELAQSLGHEGYVEHHLDHLAIDDSATDALLAPLDTLPMSSPQMIDAGYTAGAVATPFYQLKQATLIRAITSKRQLYERTVGFFTDHLSIFHRDGGVRMHKTVDCSSWTTTRTRWSARRRTTRAS